MEAIKKQASKLMEQVAKQQQAVLGQLGHLGNEASMVDDAELQCHQQLLNLYNSTRAAKHFQRDIVRGVEGFISTSKKQMEIATTLAEDCCKYGTDNQSAGTPLARVALQFGTSHRLMENERETMLQILGSQVSEPLRALIKGAPLEDARHLSHHYERLRQEVETQAAKVIRRQSKCNPTTSMESSVKLQSAEKKLTELRSVMMALGREAIAAMLSVENQQQRQIQTHLAFGKVHAEKSYHQNIITTLDALHSEMIMEKQLNGSSSQSVTMQSDVCVPPAHDDTTSNGPDSPQDENQDESYIAKVIHSFDAQAEGELSLSVDDYVVVRQVAPNGWSEGECRGNAGWFPSAYVERRQKAPASKITDTSSSP